MPFRSTIKFHFRCKTQKPIEFHHVWSIITCSPDFERWSRDTFCGRTPDPPNDWKTHPWFVALRYRADNSQKAYFTGTLISNLHIVTAAEIFNNRRDEKKWFALPGAHKIANQNQIDIWNQFGENLPTEWIAITSIAINPLYDET